MFAKQQNKMKIKSLVKSLYVFRLNEKETVKMFGTRTKSEPSIIRKRSTVTNVSKLGIPTKLTAQVGVKTSEKAKPLFTLVNLEFCCKPYCINMLDLLKPLAGSTVHMPVTPILNTLTKFTAGYWNVEKFVKSIGKYHNGRNLTAI